MGVMVVVPLSLVQVALCVLMVNYLRKMRLAEKRKAEAVATFSAALQKSMMGTKALIEKLRKIQDI
ncbi:hypothetical protein [Thioclava sp. F36-6]|uniref:hypothetical protein n=1 Tax=Thioclava sp. F36-6 TaxID=1915316 RepID=UPI000995E31C|nr:hypothetical protein [Thioclava sp. F36-6]OOY31568.1 hypothetical protein BMI88_10825 [Thioclava sp. F36-6]